MLHESMTGRGSKLCAHALVSGKGVVQRWCSNVVVLYGKDVRRGSIWRIHVSVVSVDVVKQLLPSHNLIVSDVGRQWHTLLKHEMLFQMREELCVEVIKVQDTMRVAHGVYLLD